MIKQDDISGEQKDVAEVTFALNGQQYSLDLGPRNLRKLEKALEPFVDAATASSTVRAIRAAPKAAPEAGRPKGESMSVKVREWAKAHNIDVPPRGRISNAIIAQYDEYESKHTNVG